MRWDGKKFDGIVLLGANRAKGLWANQLQLLHAPVTRNGGRLNSSATSHTLLTFALTNALRSISNRMAADLISKRSQGDGRNRPALLIKAIDNSFLPALKSAMQGQQLPQLRVIRSLHQPLAHQVSRFKLVFETEEQNPAILGMLDWTAHSILAPSADISDLVPVLLPAAVNIREQSPRH